MRTLLKNAVVVNVFTGELERLNVLLEEDRIAGVGDYTDAEADVVHDVRGKYICPGFIDGHIHIESTMLSPAEFARAVVCRGTTAVVADPHEIANVCGGAGIDYMLAASEGLPVTVYLMLPSCVPATGFCESGAVLEAEELEPFYAHPRVLGLGEVMNYVGVIRREQKLLDKIRSAQAHGRVVNGHAPLLSGKDLDRYIAAGIRDDHECSSPEEAMERIRKGQRIMIRQGTAARNLSALLPLFDEPWASRCMLVTDDKSPADLLQNGHIDEIIRLAVRAGKPAVTAIRMATLWAAEGLGLHNLGAVAPGYTADLLVLDDLDTVAVCDVYKNGVRVVRQGKLQAYRTPAIPAALEQAVRSSFRMSPLTAEDFHIDCAEKQICRVIATVPGELLTNEEQLTIDFAQGNGIDTARDILKIAVVERHRGTGHKGVGLIRGIGLQCGAIAASVSHDSHNLIIIGASESDMAAAGNRIRALGGGMVAVRDGEILAEAALPIAGLMTDRPAEEIAEQSRVVKACTDRLGAPAQSTPFMTMAFISLPVIPHLKLTTLGLVDVDHQAPVALLAEE